MTVPVNPADGAPSSALSTARTPGRRWFLAAFIAVIAVSANLRPVVNTIGPVLEEISTDLGFGSGVAGVLTALPGLVFGVVAAVTVSVARRLGTTVMLTLALVILAVGLLARSLATNATTLIVFTVVALIGAGIGNVLVPAFIKTHFAGREAGAMSAYATALPGGGVVAALVTAPTAQLVPGGWRAAMGGWAVVALLALVPWLIILRHERRLHGGAPPRRASARVKIWRSPQAVALAAFFGVQSLHAYVQFGWIAQIFRDSGLSATTAGSLLAIMIVFGIPAGLLMPRIVARVANLNWLMIGFGALVSAGYLGILWWPTTMPWLWAICLGLAGMAFPASLALMNARTRSADVTASVSGFTQFTGYLLAAVGPFVVGAVHGVTGSWTVPLVGLAALGPILAWLGCLAARPRMIDDDLAPAEGPLDTNGTVRQPT